MRLIRLSVIALSLVVVGCAGGRFNTPNASGYYASSPKQCVPFAREKSGIQLYGDAHTWWDQAASRYNRGNRPWPGSVLVLSRTPRMYHGHVAVVKRLIDARHIDVSHSNWGSDRTNRRKIYEAVRVEDVSPYNDWTQVKFWNHDLNCYGFPYEAKGFIYP